MLLDRAESYLVSSSTALENAEKLLLSDKYRLVKLQVRDNYASIKKK